MSEYHGREMTEHVDYLHSVERAPIQERREARAEWAEHLRRSEHIAEQADWLIAGHYGYGPCYAAWRVVLGGPRLNKCAALGVLLAAYLCRCDGEGARRAWTGLSTEEQEAVNAAILGVISAAQALPREERPINMEEVRA